MTKTDRAIKLYHDKLVKEQLKNIGIEYCCNCHKYTKWIRRACMECKLTHAHALFQRIERIYKIRKSRKRAEKRKLRGK